MHSRNQPHSHEQRSIHHMAMHCEKMWLYRILRVLLVMEEYVAVKRERPGSHYNGMTQYVPKDSVDIVDKRPAETKVAVWWLNRKAKSPWSATLVPEEEAPPLHVDTKKWQRPATVGYYV